MEEINAFIKNNCTVQYLTNNRFPPAKIEKYFVVYDSNIDLDNQSSHITYLPTKTNSTSTNSPPKYRIGNKNRKVSCRSTD